MAYIAVVDDRKKARDSLVRNIGLQLDEQDSWSVFGIPPLQEVSQYPAWISEHEVAVLVVDERLHEEIQDEEGAVNYNGHGLVSYLRERMPTFPLFVVTAHQDEPDLLARASAVEDIIERNKFADDSSTYVARMVRAGRRYVDELEDELSQISKLSERIAAGEGTHQDGEKLGALRAKLAVAFDDITSRASWLTQAENRAAEIEKLVNELQSGEGNK